MEIIAEIGQNHNGDMGLAREMIFEAAAKGADCAKFQLYDAVALFPKEGNPWYEYNLKTEISRSQVDQLAGWCEEANIEFMAARYSTLTDRLVRGGWRQTVQNCVAVDSRNSVIDKLWRRHAHYRLVRHVG